MKHYWMVDAGSHIQPIRTTWIGNHNEKEMNLARNVSFHSTTQQNNGVEAAVG
jgi:hypothetical protein